MLQLPEGALLLLFTDGLVEGRAQPVEAGMLALRNAVAELGDLEPAGLEGSATRCCAPWAATAVRTTTARCWPC